MALGEEQLRKCVASSRETTILKVGVITSTVPPSVCGVGDYTHRLCQRLQKPGVLWNILIPEGMESAEAEIPNSKIATFSRSSESLRATLEACGHARLILQYVGFAFHRKGVPRWLPRALRDWKRASDDRRLLVMFHELWGQSMPWRPSFYREFFQIRIVRDLCRLADVTLVSSEKHSCMLMDRFGAASTVVPIPSNVNVHWQSDWLNEDIAGSSAQRLNILVFGRKSTRIRAIHCHSQLLSELSARKQLMSVRVFGENSRNPEEHARETALLNSVIHGADIVQLGQMDEIELSRELSRGHLLLGASDTLDMQKSGTCKAAFAHGCPVICKSRASGEGQVSEGLPVLQYDNSEAGIASLLSRLTIPCLQSLGLQCRAWYLRSSDWNLTFPHYESFIH